MAGRPIRHLLPQQATVSRLTRVPTGAGQWANVHAVIGTIPCRVTEPVLVQRTDQQGRIRADLVRMLYAEAGANLRTGDKVSVPALDFRGNVEGVADQADKVYRRALIAEE